MALQNWFEDMRLRNKLLISYAVVFLLIIAMTGFTMYAVLKRAVESSIESELNNATMAIVNMVRTSVSVSIKNYLRSAAEQNLKMVQQLYMRYQRGEMTESEAKAMATRILLSQRIGSTGYIACVNSRGVMVVHPEAAWINQDITAYAFVQEMITLKEGYLEYDWKNPGDTNARPKALYMVYFAPWDWIIDVSSYRKEFMSLVKIEDFKAGVLSLRFGKTGYAYVTDGAGNVIIHPRFEGLNLFKEEGVPNQFFRDMVREKTGKLVYSWQNPNEFVPRKKLVIFNYLPEYDWIVACSSYFSEFYAPVETLTNVIVFIVVAAIVLVLPMSFLISASVTNPLAELIAQLAKGASGDFSVRMLRRSHDEIGHLATYFNTFMARLEQNSSSLMEEIMERKQAEEALRISEEKYRSVMEAAPDPIIVYDMQGRVIYLNPAFTRVFGWSLEECAGEKMDRFVPPDTWEETHRGLATIAAGESLSSIETRRLTKTGKSVDVSIRGAVFRNRAGRPAGSVIIHRDVSEVKRLERKIMEIGEQERQNFGQDLHDDLCPHLIGIEGLGKVLTRKLGDRDPGAAQLAGKITDLVKDAISKTRHLARGLCPVHMLDRGLEAALGHLAAQAESVYGVDCRFRRHDSVENADGALASQVFHIAQEAVHNAVRHGKARHVSIDLRRSAGRFSVTVADDGSGIAEKPDTDGMGLRIMAFRANMIGGHLEVRRGDGGGTVVRLVFEVPDSGGKATGDGHGLTRTGTDGHGRTRTDTDEG
ncbi:MAG: cache domain-containing protein [Pseudomonadota bacterium]